MRNKKLLALGMASLMMVSSISTVFAADATDAASATGSIEGNGGIVGFIDKDVFTVSLPTVANIDFTIDPQELLLVGTPDATLDGSQIATGYADKVLFKDTTNYLTKTKDITIVNKSTYDVDVTLDVSVTGLTKDGDDPYTINLVDTSADGYEAGTNADMSLTVTPTTGTSTDGGDVTGSAGTAVAITDAAGTSIKTTIAAISDIEDAYEVKYASQTYSYGLKDDVSTVAFNAVAYNLSGTVNTAADWTNFNKDTAKALKATIAYTVDKHEDGPKVVMDSTGKITISNLTAAQNVANYASVSLTADDTTYALSASTSSFDGAAWDASTGGTAVFQLNSKYAVWNSKNVTVTVTLSDNSTITTSGTFTIE